MPCAPATAKAAQARGLAGDGSVGSVCHHRPAPKHLCVDCQKLLDSLQDQQIPCAAARLHTHSTLTREQQLVSQGQTPAESAAAPNGGVSFAGLLCEPCAQVARKLKDRAVNCGIIGCSRKWTWKADDQIQAFAAGKPNEPPRRMCASAAPNSASWGPRDRCRTSGCKTTWTWPRSDQLDACVADKPAPKAVAHVPALLRSVEQPQGRGSPCRRAGCKAPGATSGARSWPAWCAARVRILSATAASARRNWEISRIGNPLSHGRLPGNLHLEQGTAARGWRAAKFKEPPRSKPRLTLSRLPRLAAAMPCLPPTQL